MYSTASIVALHLNCINEAIVEMNHNVYLYSYSTQNGQNTSFGHSECNRVKETEQKISKNDLKEISTLSLHHFVIFLTHSLL